MKWAMIWAWWMERQGFSPVAEQKSCQTTGSKCLCRILSEPKAHKKYVSRCLRRALYLFYFLITINSLNNNVRYHPFTSHILYEDSSSPHSLSKMKFSMSTLLVGLAAISSVAASPMPIAEVSVAKPRSIPGRCCLHPSG